jgi:N-methylhydantoinase B
VSVRTAGAGGYGDPADRDLEAIARDLELGKLSVEAARTVYGLSEDVIDETSTDAAPGNTAPE